MSSVECSVDMMSESRRLCLAAAVEACCYDAERLPLVVGLSAPGVAVETVFYYSITITVRLCD